ncbi:NmrA family NAD(P)-binding protein [Streptomyces cocklensis]|uniref:NmrA domain-containing protein n=1 Tax=Actinacidiphila cocklensis TaxID=887465 RepID=A0A9W4DGV5_9ACTN|nr:NmrA family NAD(P)-binding protein [Actinacidiphila cocklensis]MDD1063677.1 NmrA family NAD(P)-binding protein [Actinacidiphila cocklensis]CAG6391111.1 NmrA domain-containing protein [Actinacidiphila cocklensis]
MTTARLVVVTGATGRQGGATALRLLAAGRPVRALVRDTTSPAATALETAGAELVRGDFDDPSSLPVALEGAAALFAVPPVAFGPAGSDMEREFARGRALIDAAAAVGVEHVVFTGIASTPGRPGGSEGKRRIEDHLRERIRSVTVLRPVRFMSNYLGSAPIGLDGIAHGVHRHIFPPDEPAQIIAVEDIAEFAALAFDQPDRFAGRTLELAGDAPTPAEAVSAISEATGTAIRYEQITHAEAAALNPEIARVRERWAAGSRWHADVEALRVIHPGMRTLTDWLAESGATLLRKQLLETG